MRDIPLVALVGRPNVGKSTLFNRLTTGAHAIVDDRPGVTRDRIFGRATFGGRVVRVVDTGGFDSDPTDTLIRRMREQTQLAIEEADLVLLVLDGADGLRPADEEVATLLRQSGTPMVGVVNKIDADVHQDRLHDFYRLGLDLLLPVSAEHDRGIGGIHDALRERLELPEEAELEEDLGQVEVAADEPDGPSRVEWGGGVIRVAVIGRPNVGKSSLVNRLLGEERMLASEVAGTTRDSVDSELVHEGQHFVLVDTAGIRRKRSIADQLERFSVMAAMRSIERCDVALVVIDATQAISDQDARIAALAHDAGKGVIIVANKWDLLEDPERRKTFADDLRHELPFLSYAPLYCVSAKTGRGTQKLLPPIVACQRERHRRIGTGELNRFFREVVERHPPQLHKGKRAHLYFVSQPLVRPPTFIFTTRNPQAVPMSYARYLRNQLRERFGFEGTPLWLKFRPRGAAKAKGRATKRLDR